MIQQGYYRAKEAAEYCGISERTLWEWAKKGLPVAKVGGCSLFKRENLESFIDSFSEKENQIDTIVNDVMRGLK